jgi:hypothetical protein
MTLQALDVEGISDAGVLASEVAEDIWAQASRHVLQHPESSGLFQWRAWRSAQILQNCAKASPSSRDYSLARQS